MTLTQLNSTVLYWNEKGDSVAASLRELADWMDEE